MFRSGLLVTTAIVAAGSLSFFAAQAAAFAQSAGADIAAGRDANQEFLCNYGQLSVSRYFGGSSAILSSSSQHVAFPVTGRGKNIKRIIVMEQLGPNTSSATFSAGIYSNTASGVPGQVLSGGWGRAPRRCRPATVSIAPVRLKRKQTYWVEERAPFPDWDNENVVYWAACPKTKRKAYVQTHTYYFNQATGSSASYSTPWMPQSTGVYVRLK
ncbi:MAG TPA: hypothetical protein VHY79_12505 [Rhizomicrobium sp.]|jgi:hypothetical protein|nr:hypothetical protein [Rhizomicrobium sp.]